MNKQVMNKQDYLDALKRAMTGLPPETVARTLAYYEQRFIDGLMAGRSEPDIAVELDDPRKIAMSLRASRHLSDFAQRRNPATLMRMAMSFVGLAVFNLFMVIPAMVYGLVLVAIYLSALSFYLCGVAVTASALSGQNELVLEGPLRHFIVQDGGNGRDHPMEARMAINRMGIQVFAAPLLANEGAMGDQPPHLIDRAEAVANGDLHITTDFDGGGRTVQSLVGMGMVLAGIVLSLLSIVLTRLTISGVKRYAQMNFSLLRGR